MLCWLAAGSLAQTTFYLDGTPAAYLQFPAWQYFFAKPQRPQSSSTLTSSTTSTEEAASLSFDFKCTPPPPPPPPTTSSQAAVGGLLLYADDQSSGVFLEVKLLSESTLRLRLDDRQGAVRTRNIIELQRQEINFTDGQWHRLELIRHLAAASAAAPMSLSLEAAAAAAVEGTSSSSSPAAEGDEVSHLFVESITLKVDSEVIHKKVELSSAIVPEADVDHHHHSHHHHQWVFIGGLPAEYRSQNSHHHQHNQLALSTAAYELHFRGAIRNVLYVAAAPSSEVAGASSSSADLRMQQPIAKHGLLTEEEADKGSASSSSSAAAHLGFQRQCTKSSSTFATTTSPRCEHGGQCYPTTAGGVYCDCSATEYEGPFCQRGKPASQPKSTVSVYDHCSGCLCYCRLCCRVICLAPLTRHSCLFVCLFPPLSFQHHRTTHGGSHLWKWKQLWWRLLLSGRQSPTALVLCEHGRVL